MVNTKCSDDDGMGDDVGGIGAGRGPFWPNAGAVNGMIVMNDRNHLHLGLSLRKAAVMIGSLHSLIKEHER